MNAIKNSILIIPMVGEGVRFKSAGYDIYKPFIKVNECSMLDGVIKPFKDFDEIYLITTKEIVSKNEFYFRSLPHNIHTIFIPSHKLGPAYSIYIAKNQLPKNKSIFISYCDVWWHSFKIDLKSISSNDAAIFIHRGFHPHLIKDNFSAFCKSDIKDQFKLLEIKEKGSFTDDWMNEPISIGVFFVQDSEIFYNSISKFIDEEKKVAGEFYPSVIFNELLSNGLNVRLIEVESFTHIGLPSQLRDIEFWSNIINSKEQNDLIISEDNFQHCMLIGGSGSRMKKISQIPKHLLPINDKPMFIYVASKFRTLQTTIVAAPDFDVQLDNSLYKIKILETPTSSHLETLTVATEILDSNKPILFTSCDCFGNLDRKKLCELIEDFDPDVIIFSFEPSLLHLKNQKQHTSIDVIGSVVLDVDVKSKEKNYSNGMAGFFWFKSKEIIQENLKKIQCDGKNELFVDHLIQMMVKCEKKVFCMPIDPYIHLGTPDEYNEYLYWYSRGKPLLNMKKESLS